MAPLDDLNGDSVLAEFEAMIRGAGGLEPGRHGADEHQDLVPERRAVNWVNALAALAREIEHRQGRGHAELLLRKVGMRMSRELLSPMPSVRDEFEPAINRALSILDWGWVAVLDRRDTIVFEHRPPWPFEKRLDHLPFVLEGFYGDTLHRLAGDDAMQVRLTGKRGGALVFKWVPAEVAARAPQANPSSVIVPAPPPAARSETYRSEPDALSDDEIGWAAELEDAAEAEAQAAPQIAPAPEDRRMPPLADPRAHAPQRSWQEQAPRMPLDPEVRVRPSGGAGRAMLVAATVFIVLFGVGMSVGSGDIVGGLTQRLGQLAGLSAPRRTVSELESRAQAGDTDAQIRLALQLADGASTKPDYARAARWFGAAAKSGSPEAQFDLGVMTADGVGVKRDPIGAAILFMNAAAGGFPAAEYRIGSAYRNGIGVPRSAPFAAMWFERAARHGVRQAQFALAGLYAIGDGVPADPVQAYAWYRLAEEAGDRNATAKRVDLFRHMSMAQREAAQSQAKLLIGDVSGGRSLIPVPAHPTVDRLIAEIS